MNDASPRPVQSAQPEQSVRPSPSACRARPVRHARLIVGCGYLGSRVARRLLERGERVIALTRSSEHAAQLAAQGIEPLVGDVLEPASLQTLAAALAEVPAVSVLFAVSSAGSDVSVEQLQTQGLGNLLAVLPESVERMVYISTTGVYGDGAGAWVDEDSPCEPRRAGGRAALAAERQLAESRWAERAVVLRLAGIYGPQRVPHLALIAAGEPVPVPPESWLNLIEVDDAAALIERVWDSPPPSRLYVVSDGEPVLRKDFYAEVARLLGAPEPRFTAPEPTSPVARRAGGDKKVSSARLRRELGFTPRATSYRQGLAAARLAGSQ